MVWMRTCTQHDIVITGVSHRITHNIIFTVPTCIGYSVRSAYPRCLCCPAALCTSASARSTISARRRRVSSNSDSSSGLMRICAASAISSSTRAAELSPRSGDLTVNAVGLCKHNAGAPGSATGVTHEMCDQQECTHHPEKLVRTAWQPHLERQPASLTALVTARASLLEQSHPTSSPSPKIKSAHHPLHVVCDIAFLATQRVL